MLSVKIGNLSDDFTKSVSIRKLINYCVIYNFLLYNDTSKGIQLWKSV